MDRLPFEAFDDFAAVTEQDRYAPVPDDWVVGLTDVVRSTAAVEAGRYKAVNIAGAAAISAVMNALHTRHFAFGFGGDGCVFALPGEDAETARLALAGTVRWVRDELDLTLRAALVPVAELREAGADVRIALFRPSPYVAYAMFDGGGIALAERWLKAGRDSVAVAGDGPPADLSGLSCRWLPMAARHGAIVSIIARPGPAGDAAFRAAVARLVAALGDPEAFHPVPAEGAPPTLFPPGFALEAKARGGRLRDKARIAFTNTLGYLLYATKGRLGEFDAARHRLLTHANADTRKFGDALLLTGDLTEAREATARKILEEAEAAGAVRYGIHRQDAALMTCLVPSAMDTEHYHFVDGAGGGYVAAATDLNRRMKAAALA